MQYKSLDIFIKLAKQKGKKKIAVAAAEDEPVLQAIKSANKAGLIFPILVGDKRKIESISNEIGLSLKGTEIVDEQNKSNAARICVNLIKGCNAHILMKGLLPTADFLKAILDRESGLRQGELLSHIGIFETSYYHKLIGITDAAQNISPNLDDKISILINAVGLFHRIGIVKPKVAVVSATETVSPKMQPTIDAAIISMMNKRGQIKGCIIDGPLAFDNAISKESAEHKGIISEVAGDADILLMPDIETGNVLYKSLTYFGGAVVAAIILGAAAPIVLTSRSDTERSKLLSIALAAASDEH